MGEPVRPNLQDRLRLAESLLSAVVDSLAPLQRLLSEAHREIDRALREEEESARDEELRALRLEVDQLRGGLVTRGAIERAKGILMQSHGISESQAFELLNEMSQRQRRKLRDVASELADGSPDSHPAVACPGIAPADTPPSHAAQGTARGSGRGESSVNGKPEPVGATLGDLRMQ